MAARPATRLSRTAERGSYRLRCCHHQRRSRTSELSSARSTTTCPRGDENPVGSPWPSRSGIPDTVPIRGTVGGRSCHDGRAISPTGVRVTVDAVRLTQFRELMVDEFGAARAAALSRDHVFAELGGRTVEQALEAGIDPRKVWRAVCEVYEVPLARR